MGVRRRLGVVLVGLAMAGCGDTQSELPRVPEPPSSVFEDVLPGVIYTRGPGGEVVPGAVYDAPDDVLLFGTGLGDGAYVFVVVDDNCEQNLNGGPRAHNLLTAVGGKLGPMPLVPFALLDPSNPATQAGELYRVYVAPVDWISDPTQNCFGFAPLASLTTVFGLKTTESTLRR